jgi:uncharacterized cupredoxin-like copper-binding protein
VTSYFRRSRYTEAGKKLKENKSMKRRFAILFAAALLVALASVFGVTACGGGAQQKVQEGKQKVEKKAQEAKQEVGKEVQQGEQSGAKEIVGKTIRVKETEFRLKPAEITLEKPGTYVFKAVNSGSTVHALEVEGQGIEEETEEIQPAQSAELKVKLEAGTYELYCPVDGHKEEGMEGKVIVKEGSGGSGGY